MQTQVGQRIAIFTELSLYTDLIYDTNCIKYLFIRGALKALKLMVIFSLGILLCPASMQSYIKRFYSNVQYTQV